MLYENQGRLRSNQDSVFHTVKGVVAYLKNDANGKPLQNVVGTTGGGGDDTCLNECGGPNIMLYSKEQ